MWKLPSKEITMFPKNAILIRMFERRRSFIPNNNNEENKMAVSRKSTSEKSFDITPKKPTRTPTKVTPKQDNKENEENIPPTQEFSTSSRSQSYCSDEEDPRFCREHGRKLEIICLDHKCRICTNCALFGSHKNHDVKPEEEVFKEIKIRGECLIDMAQIIEKNRNMLTDEEYLGKISNKIKNKHDEYANLVHERFEVRDFKFT